MNPDAVEQLVNERVAAAITAYEASRNNGGEGSGGTEGQGAKIQGCSYKDFQNCKPITFSGKEGAVGLVRWFEKLESVFRISGCSNENRVKYSTCTLLEGALTWWNQYAQSVGIDIAYETPWEEFRQLITEEYCPRNEIQKLEAELWGLKMKGADLTGYVSRFQELALLCPTMVTPEYKRIEAFIQGLSPQIQGDVISSNPTTIQAAVRMAHKLLDQIILQGAATKSAERSFEGKRKWDGSQGKNVVQYPDKRQEMVNTYNEGQNNKRGYAGRHPYCNRCDKHHPGRCTVVCENCKKIGHMAKNCRVIAAPVINAVAPRGCFECGEIGHFKRNCPKLRRQDAGPTDGRVYMITDGETHQDSD